MSATANDAGAASAARGTVIVGAGIAGWTLARELRRLDRERPITIVASDGGDFYPKPSLSNALAQRRTPDALVTTPGQTLAGQLGVALRARTTVERIDTLSRRIETSGGPLGYDRLVLATGADPIRLPLSGEEGGRLRQVNDLDDYRAFRSEIKAGGRVAILGAGLIGSEFADDLRTAGVEVEVIDPAARPLAALLPEQAGQWFAGRLAAAGVRWRFGDAVQAVSGRAGRLVLELRAGTTMDADVVLSAVGLRPRTALAERAGLAIGRGIRVDRFGATSDPRIFAIGDCAQYEAGVLPYVQPAMTAARALAATLAGTATPIAFAPMPIVVKTPSCPVTVLPPARHQPGRWETQAQADGLTMRFLDAEDRLRGFALLGAASSRRRELLERLGTQPETGAAAARAPAPQPLAAQ